jgi:putative ABC transport system permease protein
MLLPREERNRVLWELEEFHAAKRERGEADGFWYWRQAAVLLLRSRSLRSAGGSRTLFSGDGGIGGAAGGAIAALGSFGLDLKASLRGLRRDRGVAVASVAVLALTIGVNTAVYSVADGILLVPLPYREAERLVEVWQEAPDSPPGGSRLASLDAFRSWRESSRTLERIGAWSLGRATLTGVGDPQDITLVNVTPELLTELGLGTVVGRGLTAADATTNADVLVLGHSSWITVFGGDPSVIGRTVRLAGTPYEVIGVARPGFRLPLDREVFGWTPFVPEPWERAIAATPLYGVAGWVSPGMSVGAVRRELQGLLPPASDASLASLGVRAAPVDALYRPDDRGVVALLAAVTIALLLGCLNTAQLLVARGVVRGPELVLRKALGSGRTALGRMLLVEAGVLSAVGTVAGLVVAIVLLRIFVAADPGHLPGWADVRITRRVAVYLAAVSFTAALIAGWFPARLAGRPSPASALAVGRASTPDRSRSRVLRVLLAGQAAAAVVLLAGSVLLVRSWLAVQSSDPGLNARDAYAARIVLPANRYPPGDGAGHIRFFEALRRAVEAQPGIAGASVATGIPAAAGLDFDQRFRSADRPGAPEVSLPTRLVGPGYFETLGATIIAGRALAVSDDADAERVVVLNGTAARLLFGEVTPGIIGRIVVESSRSGDRRYRVAGIAIDTRDDGLDRPPPPRIFLPWAQSRPFGRMWLIVRSIRDEAFVFEQVRAALRTIDPELPLVDATAVSDLLDRSIAARRFNLLLLTGLAGLALVVAAVGVAGLIAFNVTRTRQEIGIRMTLGARASSVFWTTTAPTLQAFAAGIAIGLLASVALVGLVHGLLFGIQPLDTWSLLIACAVLLAAGLLAAVPPAVRAIRGHPLATLRTG